MNVIHIITNGLMMMAFFDLVALVLAAVNPRYLMGTYPKGIREATPVAQTSAEKKVYYIAMTVMILVPLLFGAIGLWQFKTEGFWNSMFSSYIEWLFVNFGDLLILDFIFPRSKLRSRMVIHGTEGNACYEPNTWLFKYAFPEHLILWFFFMCPILALAQTGLTPMNALREKNSLIVENRKMGEKKMSVNSIDAEEDQFAYRYDTQLLIDKRDKDLDEDEISDYITEHFEGNSLIAAGDEDLIKIHFHTNEPWKVLEFCNSIGEIYDIVIEDMIRQSNGLQG